MKQQPIVGTEKFRLERISNNRRGECPARGWGDVSAG
jgi:hypothetical protein